MSCDHDCPRPSAFPRPIWNRPGLDTVDYRIGDYDAMRAHILALVDAAPELAGWTHRGPDDPGIALAEGAAIVGDILAQYQQLYANECFLRTAQWRESVADLVRVLGYRLAPGLGGQARIALGVTGTRPVVVPAGFPFTATLPGADAPATFETRAELDARPALSAFHLYRPRQVPAIVNGMDSFTFEADPTFELAKGDRLLVGVADGRTLSHTQVMVVEKTWEAFGQRYVKTQGELASLRSFFPLPLGEGRGEGLADFLLLRGGKGRGEGHADFLPLPLGGGRGAGLADCLPLPLGEGRGEGLASQPPLSTAAIASAAARMFGAPGPHPSPFPEGEGALSLRAGLLTSGLAFLPAFTGTLAAGLARPLLGRVPALRAYKLQASSRHFGHNAPPTRVSVDDKGRATEVAVPYLRRLDANQGDPAGPQLRPSQLPLDGEVPQFAAGRAVLVELNLSAQRTGKSPVKRVLERQVLQVDRQSLAWGPHTGASSVLSLDDDLSLPEGGARLAHADIRGITVHAVDGPAITLRAAPRPTGGAQGTGLDFFGTRADAQALEHRTTLAAGPWGTRALRVLDVDLAGSGIEPRFFRLTLDQPVPMADFDHDAPTVTVHGNLVDVTQGRTEPDATLGNGDARAAFQTFPLPKSPLTWLLDPAATPPREAQLQVWVAGVRWQQVYSLYGRGPLETVYIVREDDEGRSWVQFGDGRTGARLPTGVGNVVGRFRTGPGANGLPADPPDAARRLPDFDQAWMLEPATGGAPPEGAARAREAAPASVQSLGRIVSLADLESEALQLPGVLKARAAWEVAEGTPRVALTVLTASRDAADAQALDLALRRAVAARGPARFALQVRTGQVLRVRLSLTVHADPALQTPPLAEAIAQALGVADDDPADDLDAGRRGLLHWRMRTFGEGLHGSQVVGAVQNVAGVRWARLEGMALARGRLFLLPPLGEGRDGGLVTMARSLALGPHPSPLPGGGGATTTLRAGGDQLLSLARSDLQLRFVDDLEDVQP